MSSAPAAIAEDRRRTKRQRALLAGKLATGDASLTFDCVIRNISADGALVETTSPHLAPAEMHLLQVTEGIVWDARVIWRNGNRLGLELLDRHDLKETTEAQLYALRRIWTHLVGH
ncbi:MAG: PilZ domain-containing protein [Caulobacter sp.]|nr:PilZ domain-containing protein [Caulobacter sp.]